MSEERQEVYKILELGTDEKNLHKHKNTGGLLYIDLSMIKFSNLSSYVRKQDKEIERLKNILDNIGYQIEGIIRKTDELEINKATGEILAKHNIELLKKILRMIVNKDVSIRSDKE